MKGLDPKLPRKVDDAFGPEPGTSPSAASGHYRSVRGEPIVEEVAMQHVPRRRSTMREKAAPTPQWTEADESVPTPRPNVTLQDKPRIVKHDSELVDLPLDARSGFLLGLVDGKTSAEQLVDVSGMEAREVLEVLERLLVFGVIAV